MTGGSLKSVPRTLTARHRALQPLEDMEVALVRSCLDCKDWLSEQDEAALRFSLGLAHVSIVRARDGREVDLTELTHPLRELLTETLSPLLLDRRGLVQRQELASLLPTILAVALEHRDRIKHETKDLIAWSDIEDEIRNKRLVIACGGGGGAGFVYLGAFQALEDAGLPIALLSGTSIGAILGAFRARQQSFDVSDSHGVVGKLSFGLLFQPMNIRSRYGLPAPLRLLLRQGIGRHFQKPDGDHMSLEDLKIPLLVAISGLRHGEKDQEPEWYEHRLNLQAAALAAEGARQPGPGWTRSLLEGLWTALLELGQRKETLRSIIVGSDPVTRSYDLMDALGFSAAVPGVIQYDLAPESTRMARLLDDLFERKQIRRLLDGALVENVPAKAAWRAVHSGALGRRNCLVVALDSFAPKLKQPLWLPIQRLIRQNVLLNLRYAHVVKTFTSTLSPLDLVPSPGQIEKAITWGRKEFEYEMPLLKKLLAPLPSHQVIERLAS